MLFTNDTSKHFNLIRLILEVARTIDIAAIQAKYGINRKRLVRIVFNDVGKSYIFQIVDGRIKLRFGRLKPDVTIWIKELCVIKHLRCGYKIGLDPSGNRVPQTYSPLDAWRVSDISVEGDASTNDILSKDVDALVAVMANVPEERVREIIGECEHD